jgi:AraC-like DNA-binding protein
VFNLNDNFKLYTDDSFSSYSNYKKHWVAGLQTKPAFVESYGTSKMIVIQFKTLGAFIFLEQPLQYFTDAYINLDDVFRHAADETWEKLQYAVTIEEKMAVTEKFLYREYLAHKMPNEKLVNAVDSILSTKEQVPIKNICKEFNISRKHLNNLFKLYAGVSPKVLSSIHRFQHVIKKMSQVKPNSFTSFAYEWEYFDQAHFNNDFKRFSGLNPTAYLNLVESKPSLKIVPHFLPFD